MFKTIMDRFVSEAEVSVAAAIWYKIVTAARTRKSVMGKT